MRSSDNLAALIYLKEKLHKWKNIAFLMVIFLVILLCKVIFGNNISTASIGGDMIANIRIEGVISEDDYRSKVLQEIAEADYIKAVIVNIDSPGGGIVGSEVLFDELRTIAANKPIVVVMGSVAASGGYMAAVASDYIIAHNGTLTGSIGVLMESPNFSQLADKIGVKLNTYKSSPLKGSPSPFEKSNPTVDRVVQETIADSYRFFSELVMERRAGKINKKFANIIFDGRVFTGRQALEAGLIDEVGGKDEALSYLQGRKVDVKKLPIHDIEVVDKEKKMFEKIFGFLPFFEGAKTIGSRQEIMAIMHY